MTYFLKSINNRCQEFYTDHFSVELYSINAFSLSYRYIQADKRCVPFPAPRASRAEIRLTVYRRPIVGNVDCSNLVKLDFSCISRTSQLARRADLSRRVILPTCDTFVDTHLKQMITLTVQSSKSLKLFALVGPPDFCVPSKYLKEALYQLSSSLNYKQLDLDGSSHDIFFMTQKSHFHEI